MPRETLEIPAGISPSEWADLQRQFLEEGVARCRELLEGLDQHCDALQIAQLMHRWAGGAGQLGYHNITELARFTERLLRRGPISRSEVREGLSALLQAFCDLRDKQGGGVPDHVAQALRGKTVALIGFPAEKADRACVAMGLVGARPRIFPFTDDLRSASASDCDLVIVQVGAATNVAQLQAAAAGLPAGKLFLAGERGHLMALPAGLQAMVADYLFYNWEPEELLLRITLAMWRKTTALYAAPAAPAAVPCEAPEISRRAVTIPRVVAVDDDPVILAMLRATFRNQGIQCETADNGRDGLLLIQQEQPHAVVLDVNMPGMDGYEVLASIRAEQIPTQVMLLTARQQENDVVRGFQLGADDYLVKPFNPLELVARTKRLLRQTHREVA
jgi:DNA-binding response OmpR family regulator/HPt (histidine-containing phosphotransfer) domain-containing protein